MLLLRTTPTCHHITLKTPQTEPVSIPHLLNAFSFSSYAHSTWTSVKLRRNQPRDRMQQRSKLWNNSQCRIAAHLSVCSYSAGAGEYRRR